MRIDAAGLSHVGMKRNHNEDNFLMLPEERLFTVADGMGGHSSGEIASKIAVEELAEFFKMTSRDHDATWPYKMDKARNYDENRLSTGVKLANVRIFEKASSEQKYKGMGTTIVSCTSPERSPTSATWATSRVYFFHRGQLKQVTEDHSLLNDYLKAKKLTPEEIEAFPHKNVIVRALGMKDNVQVDVSRIEPTEAMSSCSAADGLSGMVPDPAIQDVLTRTRTSTSPAPQLIDLANANGGTDNVTCVLARWHHQ